MNGDSELVLHRPDAFDGGYPGRGSPQIADVLDDLAGQFVSLLGAALPGQQSGQAASIECGLCLIEGRARDPEHLGNLDHGSAFHAVAAQHFVAHLQ